MNRKQRRKLKKAKGIVFKPITRAENEARLKAMPRIDIDDIRKKAAEMKAEQEKKDK